jgi:hypothetical protein
MSSSKAASSSHTKSSSRAPKPVVSRLDQPSDLLVSVKYHNSLPYVPCGLFMKSIDQRDLSEYSECLTSSLEKNLFVWLPHLSHDIGMDIDLVDRSQFSYSENPNRTTLLDEKIMYGGNKVKKPDSKEGVADQAWFLRAHQQFDNNIMRKSINATVKSKATSQPTHYDPNSIEAIEDSFVQVDKMQQLLLNSKPGVTVEAVYDIFPKESENPSYIAKFEAGEEPFPDARSGKNEHGLKRMLDSFLCNLRDHKDAEKVSDKFTSLVAAHGEEDIDDVFGAGDDSDSDDEPSNKKMKYTWVKDFVLSVVPFKSNDETIVLTMLSNDKNSAYFETVNSRVDLSALPVGEDAPINVSVKRKA